MESGEMLNNYCLLNSYLCWRNSWNRP